MDKANIYSSCDIFVLPTLNDSWGLVVNEAIHYGLAVICSSAAAAIELVDDATGLRVQPGDPDGLHLAMAALISNQRLLRRMQMNNYGRSAVTDVGEETADIVHAISRTARGT